MDELIESLFTEELGGIRRQQRRRQQQAQAPSERQQPQAEGDPAQRGQHSARPAGSRLTRRQRQQSVVARRRLKRRRRAGGAGHAVAAAAARPARGVGRLSPNGSENSTGSRLKADDLLQAHRPPRRPARPPARPPAAAAASLTSPSLPRSSTTAAARRLKKHLK